MQEKLIQIQTIYEANAVIKPVCIEAGHIYTDEKPTQEHLLGAWIGGRIAKSLSQRGVSVHQMLFIDDFNAPSKELDVELYAKTLRDQGFSPDSVILESSLEKRALTLIDELTQKDATEKNKHGATILKKEDRKEKEVVLKQSPARGEKPACNALDAALYLQKFEDFGICITVLPAQWKSQQEAVKKVLKALGKELPIFEVYYSAEGEFEIDFDY